MRDFVQPLWAETIDLVVLIVATLALAVSSWLCLFRTRQVQRWIAELSRDHKYMVSEEDIRSQRYFWELRFGGSVTAIAALFMVYLLTNLLFRR